MRANPLTAARAALVARLETITQDNGYRTDAGLNVRPGWLNEVLQDAGIRFPVIVLTPSKRPKPPIADVGTFRFLQGFDVVAAVEGGTDYAPALDDLLLDLLRCLMPRVDGLPAWRAPGLLRVVLEAPETSPPGDGATHAIAVVPLVQVLDIPT
ncbi:hypothetical protein [Pseudomonas oryzihabitans]|uniref:hypothetical protein n=1 Tax=Pseudomonas oryzihabitans TaxID=47885 RepID=UPI0011A22E9E|nr:hypothetical protein [Pseudomonas oryzihabitans]